MPSPILQEGMEALGFTEFKDSGEEEYNFRDGTTDFIRIFDGPWENRQDFILNYILPSIETAEGESFLRVPNRYPAYNRAIPYRATVKGKLRTTRNTDINFISHEMARVTVYYQIPKQFTPGSGETGDTNFVEENVDTEVEIVPLPARKFTYEYYYTSGRPSDYQSYLNYGPQAVSRVQKKATEEGKINHIVRRINYRLKLPFITRPRWGYITTYQGSINHAPFITPSGLYAAPGQLRFDGISSVTKRELRNVPNDELGWEIELVFCYYKPGWNTHPAVVPKETPIAIGTSGGITGDLDSALEGLTNEQTKIGHVAIVPPLYPYKFHQLIFQNYSKAELLLWTAWFFSRPQNIISKFYDPDDPLDLTPEELAAFLGASEVRSPWQVQGVF